MTRATKARASLSTYQKLIAAFWPMRAAVLEMAGMTAIPGAEPPVGKLAGVAPLEVLCRALGLTALERDIVLLCASGHVDPQMRDAFKVLSGESGVPTPTVEVASRVCGSLDCMAFAPALRLRRLGIVDLGPHASLLDAPLLLDEAVLQFLLHGIYWDASLGAAVKALDGKAVDAGAEDDIAAIRATLDGPTPTLVVVTGRDHAGSLRASGASAQRSLQFDAAALPADPTKASKLGLRFRRMLDVLGAVGVVDGASAGASQLSAFIGAVGAPLILVQPRQPDQPSNHGVPILANMPQVVIDLASSASATRDLWWRTALAEVAASEQAVANLSMRLAEDFDVPAELVTGLAGVAHAGQPDLVAVERDLRRRAAAPTRLKLLELAELVPVGGGFDDLVLPPATMAFLEAIRDHMTHRAVLNRLWRMDQNAGARSSGVTAMFAGPSGTGKTVAAQKIAAELGLDLFRINLSSMVSKWIGETEKNLAAVFAAAASSAAVLLFDEADTLFGKRSDSNDAAGHFVNSVTGFLLQEMESYRGIAILTTNRRTAIDDAFLRRIRYIVDFPFPGPVERQKIWSLALPRTAPARGLDLSNLASVPLSGGQIAAAAIVGASRAAAANRPVENGDLQFAVGLELAKHGSSYAGLLAAWRGATTAGGVS